MVYDPDDDDLDDLHDLRDQRECLYCPHYRDEHTMQGECAVDDCDCLRFG